MLNNKRTARKLILTGYRSQGIKLYTPKRNKVKVGLLVGFVGLCLITPMTNWLIVLIGIILNKNPFMVLQMKNKESVLNRERLKKEVALSSDGVTLKLIEDLKDCDYTKKQKGIYKIKKWGDVKK